MSDTNHNASKNNNNLDPDAASSSNNNNGSNNGNEEDIDAKVKAAVETELKAIKEKLNNAYNARDDALKKVADFEQKEKDREVERLKEEGKLKEAHELEISEIKAQKSALEQRNIELTRNMDVRKALAKFNFRNQNAQDMAFREIVPNLVKADSGEWVHKDGTSLDIYVDKFMEDDANSFLLKPKVNVGGGTSNSLSSASSANNKSLFEMTQAEVMKLAEQGKLPKRK